jgi:hypothetical protein
VHWLAQQQPVVLCNLATSMDGSDGRHLKVQIKLPAFSRVNHLKVQIKLPAFSRVNHRRAQIKLPAFSRVSLPRAQISLRNMALRTLMVSLPRVQISPT